MKTLLIDNFDSFTYNLSALIAKATGCEPVVVRNNETTWEALRDQDFDRIVISPGPGRPQCADDLGLSAAALKYADVPILGVCLGHQAIGLHFGATVGLAMEPIHGRIGQIRHLDKDLFEGIPNPFAATRYHSLAVTDLPAELEPTAWADDGTLMALRHVARPIWGVQFHPESICTEYGERMIQNFFALSAPYLKRAAQRTETVAAAPAPEWASMRVHAHRASGRLSPREVYEALYGSETKAFWLDSSRPNQTDARYSFLGDTSGPYAEFLEYHSVERRLKVVRRGGTVESTQDIFSYLETELAARRKPTPAQCPFDFNCGYVGYFGYELKGELQGSHTHPALTPDACWIFADRMIAYDHTAGDYWLLCLDADAGPGEENRRWIATVEATLAGTAPAARRAANAAATSLKNLRWRHPPEKYLQMIHRSKELIRQGETYEVCLTNEVTAEVEADPLKIYMNLRQINSVPFGAFLRFDDVSALCASPELYLEVALDGTVESKPIKGTAPRHVDPAKDQKIADQLASSVKDRSENLMIVDLLRNDLNRCCEVGSVHVPKIFHIESFSTVHQLVSTIRGKLKAQSSTIGCVRESFPGGSMTGAPKVRTMNIIDGLEEGARGIYSGSIGYLALNSSAKLNIVIRTIVMKGSQISIGAGGAIVALSDPDEELAEIMLKAQAQIRVLQSGIDAEIERAGHAAPAAPRAELAAAV